MKHIKRYIFMPLFLLAILVLTACGSASSKKDAEQLQGTWLGKVSGVDVELIVSDDQFTMDGTVEVSGLFTKQEVSDRLMSGTIDTKSKEFIVTKVNDNFGGSQDSTSYGNWDEEEDDDVEDTSEMEGKKLTYKLSENTLILTDDSGEALSFKK